MYISSQLWVNIFSKVRGKKLKSQQVTSSAEDGRCGGGAKAKGGRGDPPEDGHFRRLVQEVVHAVHHLGVELD